MEIDRTRQIDRVRAARVNDQILVRSRIQIIDGDLIVGGAVLSNINLQLCC